MALAAAGPEAGGPASARSLVDAGLALPSAARGGGRGPRPSPAEVPPPPPPPPTRTPALHPTQSPRPARTGDAPPRMHAPSKTDAGLGCGGGARLCR